MGNRKAELAGLDGRPDNSEQSSHYRLIDQAVSLRETISASATSAIQRFLNIEIVVRGE